MATKLPSDRHYTYPALLHPRSFRLLKINSYSPHSHYKLNCSLESFGFDDEDIFFDALSYTWGPPLATTEWVEEYSSANDVRIYVESDDYHKGSASIGRNLFEALVQIYRLRTDPESIKGSSSKPAWMTWNTSPFVWADALCIDQQNEVEKSTQVAYMAEIYGKAITVFAWLGQDDGTFESIAWFHFEFLDDLMNWLDNKPSLSLQNLSTGWMGFDWVDGGCRLSGPDIVLSDAVMIALSTFYTQRRFLNRLWVRQELSLAQSVSVLCGPWIFELWRFHECGLFIFSHPYLTLRLIELRALDASGHDPDQNINPSILSQVYSMHEICRGFEGLQNAMEESIGKLASTEALYCARLFLLLQMCHGTFCHHPVDRIFGLLGMLNTNLPPDFKPLISPDYAKSPRRVFFETTTLLLTHLPYLLGLSCVEHPPDIEITETPSWIPTYGLNASSARAASLLMTAAFFKGTNTFNASGRHLHVFGVKSFSETELSLSGKLQGTIEACSKIHSGSKWEERAMADEAALLRFILEVMQSLGPHYWTGESVNEAILHGLAPGAFDKNSKVSLEEGLRSFKAWITVLTAYYTSASLHNEQLDLGELFYHDMDRIYALLSELTEAHDLPTLQEIIELRDQCDTKPDTSLITPLFETSQAFTSSLRHFNVTRRLLRMGLSFGLGPGAMEPNDQVWVLIPGRTPFILRATNEAGKYIFVGEAHVHGIMYGEGVDAYEMSDMQSITLV